MQKDESEIEQMIQDVRDGKLKPKKVASMPVEEAKIDKIDYIKQNIRRMNTVKPGQVVLAQRKQTKSIGRQQQVER